MEIKVKVEPALDDLITVATLVKSLAEIAAQSDPVTAESIKRSILYRLTRMKKVTT